MTNTVVFVSCPLPGRVYNKYAKPTIGPPMSNNATAVAQPVPVANNTSGGRKIAAIVAITAATIPACVRLNRPKIEPVLPVAPFRPVITAKKIVNIRIQIRMRVRAVTPTPADTPRKLRLPIPKMRSQTLPNVPTTSNAVAKGMASST